MGVAATVTSPMPFAVVSVSRSRWICVREIALCGPFVFTPFPAVPLPASVAFDATRVVIPFSSLRGGRPLPMLPTTITIHITIVPRSLPGVVPPLVNLPMLAAAAAGVGRAQLVILSSTTVRRRRARAIDARTVVVVFSVVAAGVSCGATIPGRA